MDDSTLDLLLAFTLISNLSLIYLLKKQKRGSRRWWVRELNEVQERQRYGHHDNLVRYMLQRDKEEFFELTRMWPNQFQKLLQLVSPLLQKKSIRRPLSPALRLALTLSYLSQGNSVRNQSWNFRVGRSTAYKIIPETCKAICEALTPEYLPPMNSEKWLKVAEGFQMNCQFPNCVGAVDGKHIRIKAPINSGSQWWCYKGHFSLVFIATCDSQYRFTWVDIGQYGSISDGGVWNNSLLGQNLENAVEQIPGLKRLPGSDISTHHAFVGDEAFPLKTYLLRPYSRRELGDAERIFNYRLSRARRTIENAFGILTSRWQIFSRCISCSPENASEIVKSTVCLHNFLMSTEEEMRLYCPLGYVDRESDNHVIAEGEWQREHQTNLADVRRLGANNAAQNATSQRDALRDYFVSPIGEEQAPWQYVCAFRGLNINIPQ